MSDMGLPVKLSRIIEAIELQTDESTPYVDRKSGDVIVIMEEELNAAEDEDPLEEYPEWQRDNIEKAREFIDRKDDFLSLPTKLDINEYGIIENFCRAVKDGDICEDLSNSIHGKGAFGKFRNAIERFNMEDEWYEYRDRSLRQIAIDWCEENDIPYSDDSI